jgi:hypothetical protein
MPGALSRILTDSSNSHWTDTMLRCVLAASVIACAPLAALLSPAEVSAQMLFQRAFPPEALRGEMTFGAVPPEAQLNGAATRLAPGARIRGQNNMLVMSGTLMGQTFIVHYTRDLLGQPKDIWLLRPDELERTPWPTTAEESKTWVFDPAKQTWAKP